MSINTLKSGSARSILHLALFVSVLFAGVHTLFAAQQDGPNAGEKVDALAGTAQATHQSYLASELAAYGRQTQNAMALIVAAEMQAQAGGRDVPRDKQTEGPDEPGGDKEAGEDNSTVEAMLSDARDLARGDESLLAAIEQVESQESKGRVGGPVRHRDSVRARHHDIYNVRFYGGEPAIVTVVGDGDTDLDLRIYDQNGNLICRDTDYTDRNYCRWQPLWTGNFRIKVTNLGRVYNRYTISTN